MSDEDDISEQTRSKVSNWIISQNFKTVNKGKLEVDTNLFTINDVPSNISLASIKLPKMKLNYEDFILEGINNDMDCDRSSRQLSDQKEVKEIWNNSLNVKDRSVFSNFSQFQLDFKSSSAPPTVITAKVEKSAMDRPERSNSTDGSMTIVASLTVVPSDAQALDPLDTQALEPLDTQTSKPLDKEALERLGSFEINAGRKPCKWQWCGSSVDVAKLNNKYLKNTSNRKLRTVLSHFFGSFLETCIVCALLIFFDLIVNAEEYDFPNYIFNI